VSGEASTRETPGTAALERAFGERARCNACSVAVADYRVVALFLHETAVVRAYCPDCYGAAADGDYFARGDGLVLGYPEFAARFGPPGPPPRPAGPVDRLLTALVRAPEVRSLSPASEAVARRRRQMPYRFVVGVEWASALESAELRVRPDGQIEQLSGGDAACALVRQASSAA
jgi:hypothetical protein